MVYEANRPLKRAVINVSGAADTEIVAAVPGKSIRVLSFLLVAGGAITAVFKSEGGESDTNLTGVMTLADKQVVEAAFHPGGHFETVAGQPLHLVTTTAGAMGWLTYQEI